jgi:hypothetical protein
MSEVVFYVEATPNTSPTLRYYVSPRGPGDLFVPYIREYAGYIGRRLGVVPAEIQLLESQGGW